MDRKLKRQTRTIGSLVKIPLESGFHTYARILEVEMAFYNVHTNKELTVEEILNAPKLFIATVYDDAITKGYWPKISKAIPLEKDLIETPPKYTQNRLNLNQYKIYYFDKTVAATKEECVGLEYWIVWSAEQMEERLNDHFAGRHNLYVEKMKRAEMYSDKMPITRKIKTTHQNINRAAV